MKQFFFLVLSLFFINPASAQFKLVVNSNRVAYQGDTIKSCQDSITFTAIAKLGNDTVNKTSNFKWDYDDGTFDQAVGRNVNKKLFKVGGGYFVRVIAENGTYSDTVILPVYVSMKPYFKDTKSDVPSDKGICEGDEINLTGVAPPRNWKFNLQYLKSESQLIDKTNQSSTFTSIINHRAFSQDARITALSQIDSIGIKMAYSNSSDLQIKLTCPNNQSIILKNSGGNNFVLGEIQKSGNLPTNYIGYQYYWTSAPQYGILNSSTTGIKGTFASETPLANLIGCPMNGDWKIEIKRLQLKDSGYFFNWELRFNPNYPIPKWTFQNSYSKVTSIWTGPGVSATSNGITTAIPASKGTSSYFYTVNDNFTCKYDTMVSVKVEGVTFTVNPNSGEIPLRVSFASTTSWAKQFDWDLGDGSAHSLSENTENTYNDKGRYKIKLIATSSQGCKDFDTTSIVVTVPPSKINDYNVFTPNDDQFNNIFRLIKADDISFKSFEAKIYARWGKLVCEWRNVEEAKKGWDGTIGNNGGVKASSGVYFFVVKAVGKDDKVHMVPGTINLYRGQ